MTNRSETICLAGPGYRREDQLPEIAIVGASLGADEEAQGRPFIQDVGAVLTPMTTAINGISPLKFPSALRDHYTLLNAHAVPRYQIVGQPNVRTQPTHLEVMKKQPITRIVQYIRDTGITRLLLAVERPQRLTPRIIAEFEQMGIFWLLPKPFDVNGR